MVHSFNLFDQEAEVEYVEGDYELEEEEELDDDIEDMGDFLNANNFGTSYPFYFVDFLLCVSPIVWMSCLVIFY